MPSARKKDKANGTGAARAAKGRSRQSTDKTSGKTATKRTSAAVTGKTAATSTKAQAASTPKTRATAVSGAATKSAAKSAKTAAKTSAKAPARVASKPAVAAKTESAANRGSSAASKSAARASAAGKTSKSRSSAAPPVKTGASGKSVADARQVVSKATEAARKGVEQEKTTAVKSAKATAAVPTAKPRKPAPPSTKTPATADEPRPVPVPPRAAEEILAPKPETRARQPERGAEKISPVPGAAAAPPVAAPALPTADEDRELAKRNETPAAVPAEKTDVKPSSKGAPVAAKAKPAGQKQGFKLNEFIVYPAHGVGQIVGVETQEVAGFSLELFVVSFIKDKMILKVPTSKVGNVGMRKLAETNVVDKALATLSGRARIKRTMWSRRAQEYEAKINSGDLVTIAEVVRDLYRSDTQPEQSYSERQLYEAALDRMAREIAAVRKLIDSEALKLIESFLQKGPRRGQKADGEAGDEGDEEDVDRAA